MTIDYVVAGHEAAGGASIRQDSPAVKQEQRMPATNAALPPAYEHLAPNGPSGECNGACTCADVIADMQKEHKGWLPS